MKKNISDFMTTSHNGKRSKAQQIKNFEKKLRDIYSDEEIIIKPNANMTKKQGHKNWLIQSFDFLQVKIS